MVFKVSNPNEIDQAWGQASIPQWQRILQASIGQGNQKREEYARWMLGEVLKVPGS